MSENQCCGNCKHFKDEDVNGFGQCGKDGVITRCNTFCSDYSSRLNGWTEITPDNVEEFYKVDAYRIVIAVIDKNQITYYTRYAEMSTSLGAMAKIGGCYGFVLPELKQENEE